MNHGQAVVDVTVRPNFIPNVLILLMPLNLIWFGIFRPSRGIRVCFGVCLSEVNAILYFFCIWQYCVSCSKESDFGFNCTIALLSLVCITVVPAIIALVGKCKCINDLDIPDWSIIPFISTCLLPLWLAWKSRSGEKSVKKLRLALLIGVLIPQVVLQIVFVAANGWTLPINLYDLILLSYMPFMSLMTGICVVIFEIINLVICGALSQDTDTEMTNRR